MTNTFFTIITADYYPYAVALYKSLKKYDPNVLLQVFVTDSEPPPHQNNDLSGLKIIPVKTLQEYSFIENLYRKYAHIDMNFFRWSLKPVLICYLLENGFEKVFFTDCDIFFFHDYHFLFDELNESDVILTPHWHNANPLTDENSFVHLLTSGMFNAGFIGANRGGVPALQWWADACHFKMGVFKSLGIHDDQRYLDVLPVKFENVKIIRHKGCNLSSGNDEECKRELINGSVLINGQYPIIFIHFSPTMAKQILKGHDPLLLPYFNQYKRVFEESGYRLSDFIQKIDTYASPNALKKVKWLLRPKTRLKAFLYKLASRL